MGPLSLVPMPYRLLVVAVIAGLVSRFTVRRHLRMLA